MGLIHKEMHLFRPWKTLTPSMQLLSAYKRLPPIRCLHPNHGSCSNHQQTCLKDQCVSSLPCIQCLLFQILPHVFEPPILRKEKMSSSLLAYSLSKGIMPCWHQKWPCRRQGCHNGCFWMKMSVHTLSGRPPASAFTRGRGKNRVRADARGLASRGLGRGKKILGFPL
jgi:hypothetical protein